MQRKSYFDWYIKMEAKKISDKHEEMRGSFDTAYIVTPKMWYYYSIHELNELCKPEMQTWPILVTLHWIFYILEYKLTA